MFKEIRENKKEEKNLVKKYTQIKSKTDITTKEADDFWKAIFLNLKEEV